MKFFSLAPNYHSHTGHSVAYQCSVRAMCESLGLEYTLLVPTSTTITADLLPLEKWFEGGKLSLFKGLKKAFASEGMFFLESWSFKDLCFLTFASILYQKRTSPLVLLFRREVNRKFFRRHLSYWLLAILKGWKKEAFCLMTDSALIAEDYAKQFKLILKVMPIPHTDLQITQEGERGKEIICWWPGVPREEKGRGIIQQLCKTLPKDVRVYAAESSGIEGATPLADHLPRLEYEKMFEVSDIALLPYCPKTYRAGTSGVLVEALMSNTLPLVREGSYLAYELRRFSLDRLIVDWDDPAFFDRARELLADHEIKANFAKMQEAYLDFHSLERFTEAFRKELPQLR